MLGIVVLQVTTRHLPELNGARVLHACGMYETKRQKVSPKKTHINSFFVQVADCCGGNERQGGGSFKCRDSPTFQWSSPGKEAFFLHENEKFLSSLGG